MPWEKIQPEKRSKRDLARFLGRPSFYCDHNVHRSIVDGLRQRKYDIETAGEVGGSAHPDEFHYRRAFKTKRVLLTQDNDYLDSAKFPLSQTRGVVVLRIDGRNKSQVDRALEFLDIIVGTIGPALNQTKLIVNSDYTLTMIDRAHPAGGFVERNIRFRLDDNGKDVWHWSDE